MPVTRDFFPRPSFSLLPHGLLWSFAVVLGASLVGFAFSPRQVPEVVQTQRVELVDSTGAVLAEMSASQKGLRLALRSGDELFLTPDASLVLKNSAGQEIIRLGGPMVRPTTEP